MIKEAFAIRNQLLSGSHDSVEKRREHSRKPDCVRERIEALVDGPYLELFARETKPGWDCWGNQMALFDSGPVSTRRQPSTLVDNPQLPF